MSIHSEYVDWAMDQLQNLAVDSATPHADGCECIRGNYRLPKQRKNNEPSAPILSHNNVSNCVFGGLEIIV